MRKKFNYFDDDYDENGRVKKANAKPDDVPGAIVDFFKNIDYKKILSYIVKVLSFIGFVLLTIAGAIQNLFKRNRNTKWRMLLQFVAIIAVVILLTVIIVTAVMSSASKINQRDQEFNTAAKEVCTEYTERYGVANYKFMNSEYGVKGCMLTGLCVAREVDFDNDGKSELLLGYNDNDMYFEDIWGFYGDEFIKLYSSSVVQSDNRADDVWMSIYSDGTEFFVAEHNPEDISDVTILKISGDEFKKKTSAHFDPVTLAFTMHKKGVSDKFERIRFAVLSENAAALVVEATIDTIDQFSKNTVPVNEETNGEEANVDAESISTDAMASAYYSIVCDYNRQYGVSKYEGGSKTPHLDGLAVVNLTDFNGDGVDELVLIYRRSVNERRDDKSGDYIAIEVEKYFLDIYTWNGNNAILVHQNEGLSCMPDDYDTIYYMLKLEDDKKSLCFNTFSSSENNRVVTATSKILSFNERQFEQDFKATYEKNYGYYSYYIDGQSVYKNQFESKGGFSAPFFDGDTTYDSNDWMVIYLQGTRDDESKIKGQVSKTEDAIKTLNKSYNPDNVKSE